MVIQILRHSHPRVLSRRLPMLRRGLGVTLRTHIACNPTSLVWQHITIPFVVEKIFRLPRLCAHSEENLVIIGVW